MYRNKRQLLVRFVPKNLHNTHFIAFSTARFVFAFPVLLLMITAAINDHFATSTL